MSDPHDAPPELPDRRGAVARLTEAVAAAQAVARDGVAGDAAPASGDTGEVVSTTTTTTEAGSLWDRIDALPPVEGSAAQPLAAGQAGSGRPHEDEPDGSTGAVSPPPAEPPVGAGRRRRAWPLVAVMMVLILAVPALVYTGYRIASDSTTGEVLRGRVKPDEPGYTALVEPTPVALVMQVSDSGEAQGLTVLSLSGPAHKGGAVIASPVDVRLRTPRLGIDSFAGTIGVNRTETAARVIGSELGLGFTEVIKLTDADLVTLLEPVSPLQVDNPEAVTTTDGDVIEAGTVELTAADVPAYLTAEDVGHTSSGKLTRQQLVWSAWIHAITEAGGSRAIPGESDVGIGHYLGRLAAGDVQTATFPVTAVGGGTDAERVEIDRPLAAVLVANAVPFPVAAVGGDRATVALLNGTAPGSPPASVIQRLTVAGAQITTMGNAPRFGQKRTTLTYSDPAGRLFAQAMAKRLGAGRIVRSTTTDKGVDVVVVLGDDVLSDPPGPVTAEEVDSNR